MFLKELKILPLIFLIGIFLRIIALNSHDFWLDEALTYHFAKLPLKDLLAAVLSDNNPPLYYLLMHFILKINSNELVLRLPSFLANILAIPLLFILLKQHANQKVALIATSLFAVSPLSIYLATEARLHALAQLLLLLIIYSFLNFSKKINIKTILPFIIFSTLGLYTQYYIALVFIPFALFISLKKWLLILMTLLFILSPWLILSAQSAHNGCWCPNTVLSLPSSLVSPILAGVGIVTLRSYPDLPIEILVLFSFTALVTLIFFLKGLSKNYRISAIYLIPLITLSTLGFFWPVFSPKAFAIYSPLFFAIVAYGIYFHKKSSFIMPILLLVFGFISLIQIIHPFFKGERLENIYSLIKYDNYPIAHTSLITYYPLRYYSSENNGPNILLTTNPLQATTLNFLDDKRQINNQIDKLWLVDTPKLVNSKEREQVLANLMLNYRVINTFTIDNISVSFLTKLNDQHQ